MLCLLPHLNDQGNADGFFCAAGDVIITVERTYKKPGSRITTYPNRQQAVVQLIWQLNSTRSIREAQVCDRLP